MGRHYKQRLITVIRKERFRGQHYQQRLFMGGIYKYSAAPDQGTTFKTVQNGPDGTALQLVSNK